MKLQRIGEKVRELPGQTCGFAERLPQHALVMNRQRQPLSSSQNPRGHSTAASKQLLTHVTASRASSPPGDRPGGPSFQPCKPGSGCPGRETRARTSARRRPLTIHIPKTRAGTRPRVSGAWNRPATHLPDASEAAPAFRRSQKQADGGLASKRERLEASNG